MDPDDSDAAALRARVDALEQTVSEQQATIEALSSPTPSRRGVLAALTGVAGAGALGAYSQRGAAQAAGQVGTSAEPVDVEAWSLTVQDQLAGDLDAGGNDLTNVGAAEVNSLNNADVSNAAAETVPVAQGDGSLSMGTVGENTPDWQEDANSPIDGSGSQTHQITLDGSYDLVCCHVQRFENTSGGTQDMRVQANGRTSGYAHFKADGALLSNNSAWYDNGRVDGRIIRGSFTLEANGPRINIYGPFGDGGQQTVMTGYNQETTANSISSVTLGGADGTTTVKARVYGWSGSL